VMLHCCVRGTRPPVATYGPKVRPATPIV
jgi:hypothetical protein